MNYFLFAISVHYIKNICSKNQNDIFDTTCFFSHFFDMVLFLTIIFSSPKSSINSLWSYIFISVRNDQLYLNRIPIIPKQRIQNFLTRFLKNNIFHD